MPANTSPIFELTPVNKGAQFTSTDTTTKKTLLTAGTNGTRIDAILVSTNDTSAVNLAFYINDGSTDFYIGNLTVPLGSGYTTVARVDGIGTIGAPSVGALIMPSGYLLKANCVATMTTTKVTDVMIVGGDF